MQKNNLIVIQSNIKIIILCFEKMLNFLFDCPEVKDTFSVQRAAHTRAVIVIAMT